MASEWPVEKLSELTRKITKGTTPSKKDGGFVPAGVNFIKAECVTLEGTIDESKFAYVTTDVHEKYKRSHLEADDILFSMAGVILGKTAVVKESHLPANTNQALALIRPVKEKVFPRYLHYFLQQRSVFHFVNNSTSQSAQPNINLQEIGNLDITLPSLPEQKAIAHILGSLDDKIELNRRMNETLEGMAQALFKSWFVDFDPVIDNILVKNMAKYPSPNLSQGERDVAGNEDGSSPSGRSGDEGSIFDGIPDEFAARAEIRRRALRANDECSMMSDELKNTHNSEFITQHSPVCRRGRPQALFPDSFQTSELGPIPTGWKVRQVKDFGSVICGKTPPKKNANYYGEDVPFIKIPDMHDSAWITETSDGLSLEGAKSQAKKEIPPNSICVSCIATVGKVVITSRDSHTNQQINSVVPERDAFRYYLYFAFSGMTKELHDLASGGSATLNLNTGNFSKIQLLSPSDEVMNAYYSSADPLFRKMLAGDFEAQTLTKLRDTLLPKLISGELRVPQAEQMIRDEL